MFRGVTAAFVLMRELTGDERDSRSITEHTTGFCVVVSSPLILPFVLAVLTDAMQKEGRRLPFSLVTHVLPIGGGVLVDDRVLWRRRGGEVEAPVAVVAAVVVLLLHLSVCHFLPQLLQLCWNYA